MHDRNGTPLQTGDTISIEYVITAVYGGPDYCNISARSVEGRKPDGTPEFYTGNTAVATLVRRASPPAEAAEAPALSGSAVDAA